MWKNVENAIFIGFELRQLWEKCNVYTGFMGNCWEYHEKYDGKWQFHGGFQSEFIHYDMLLMGRWS